VEGERSNLFPLSLTPAYSYDSDTGYIVVNCVIPHQECRRGAHLPSSGHPRHWASDLKLSPTEALVLRHQPLVHLGHHRRRVWKMYDDANGRLVRRLLFRRLIANCHHYPCEAPISPVPLLPSPPAGLPHLLLIQSIPSSSSWPSLPAVAKRLFRRMAIMVITWKRVGCITEVDLHRARLVPEWVIRIRAT